VAGILQGNGCVQSRSVQNWYRAALTLYRICFHRITEFTDASMPSQTMLAWVSTGFRSMMPTNDHPLPSYSFIAADMLRDLVTLTFDLLTLVSGHTWQVTWSTPPPSLKILCYPFLWVLTSPIGYHWRERAGHLEARFQGEGVVPLPIYWYHSKGNWLRYNFAADSFYIMRLCSRLFVLYCRCRPKDDKSRHFDPHFEEVRGGVEPWWMARWWAVEYGKLHHRILQNLPLKTVVPTHDCCIHLCDSVIFAWNLPLIPV